MSLKYANSYIAVRAFDTYEPLVGLIHESRKSRVTEIDALQRMLYGPGIIETDTIGEARRAGKCQCKRCLQYKEPAEFRKHKKGQVEYQYHYCKACETEMARTRRFSRVMPGSPYPQRLE